MGAVAGPRGVGKALARRLVGVVLRAAVQEAVAPGAGRRGRFQLLHAQWWHQRVNGGHGRQKGAGVLGGQAPGDELRLDLDRGALDLRSPKDSNKQTAQYIAFAVSQYPGVEFVSVMAGDGTVLARR